jgi:hypothetical protein
MECNGIAFETEVEHSGHWVMSIYSLWGIDGTLRHYGEVLGPQAIPFAGTVSNDSFCLMEDGTVHVTNTLGGPDFDDFKMEPAAASFEAFVEELKVRANSGG